MISIGEYNTLKIIKQTKDGLLLGDTSGEVAILPIKQCPDRFEIDDKLTVFVYKDKTEKNIATTLAPKLLIHQFAFLQVVDMTPVGAFLDWGLEKHLLVPYKEQQQDLEKGRWYVVYLDKDEKDRLFASTYIERQLQNVHITAKVGEEVSLIIYQQTDLGYKVIVNNEHLGLVFENEIFKDLNIGDKLKGYVKNIREDNKLDITLQPTGFRNVIDSNTELIYKTLVDNNGFLAISDKSAPDEIYDMFGMSKKAFKRSIGVLYKQRKILIDPTGIKLTAEKN